MKKERSMKKVLIIEDEKNVAQALTANLKNAGYSADTSLDGEEGLRLALTGAYELVVIETSISNGEGLAVCGEIRAKLHIPIIMVSPKADETEEIKCFELGADDYVVKPLSAKAFAARVKAHICRASGALAENSLICTADKIIKIRELTIDTKNYIVMKSGKEIKLSKKEYEVLLHLAVHVGELMSREDLLKMVWGYDGFFGDVRTVDVTMSRLRAKIEEDPRDPEYIFTKRTKGYYIPA